ncbi:hypothetical protein ACTG9Q_15775 [Actinokineospora sp. 24-640]
MLRMVAGDPSAPENLRTRAAVALVDLGRDAGWMAFLEHQATSADRDAAVDAVGALVVRGSPDQAVNGLRRAGHIATTVEFDRASVLCLRLLAGYGTSAQVEAAVHSLLSRPEPATRLWEVVYRLQHPGTVLDARTALEQVCDDNTRPVDDRMRAAELLLPSQRAAALLESVARGGCHDPFDRYCALDDLVGAGVPGPWLGLLADVARACVHDDSAACIGAAEALVEHGCPATATSVLTSLVLDGEHHITARVRAAKVVLDHGAPGERAAAADVLATACSDSSPGTDPFDRFLAAEALLDGSDGDLRRRATSVLVGIAADHAGHPEDRFFAAKALHHDARASALGAEHLLLLAEEASPLVRLWVAEQLAGLPVLSPRFWSTVPSWANR